MTDATDTIVFLIVVGLRFFVPLLIPRYPLPAILAALIIDGVDQTIFQTFTNLPLEGYQGYDKALDIYYLTIAYISTMRNWSNLFAFQISRFLFYWRLVGVTAFELLHWRPLLLIFPNTFEYFFIFYETYRLRYDPKNMTKKFALGAAAFIWIVIKLPQEWWIHIAQLDTTDFIKENILGVPVDTPWSEALAANLWVIPVVLVVAVILVVVIRWAWKRLPPAERKLSFDADVHQPRFSEEQGRTALASQISRLLDWTLVEKIFMVSLIGIIFSQVLPDVRATNLQLAVGVAFVIVINTALSHWLARRGRTWTSAVRQFFVMAVVNFGLVVAYALFLPNVGSSLNLGTTLFFALMLTLLVTLYDRYRLVYLVRFSEPVMSEQ